MPHSPVFGPKFRIGSGAGVPAIGELNVEHGIIVGTTSNADEALDIDGHGLFVGGDRWVYSDTQGSYGYDMVLSGGWGGCFEGDTPIQTPTGFTPIKDLQTDDVVVAYNTETETLTEATVLASSSRTSPSHFIINGTIKVTREHPIYTRNGFVEVKLLTTSDELFDGTDWIAITSIEKSTVPIVVYNLAVSEPDTYFAGGILAHNKDTSSRPGGDALVVGGAGSYGGADGNTILGYDGSSVQGYVNISNAYFLPRVDGTANQVLKTDGLGTVTWQDDSTTGFWQRVGTTLSPATAGDDVHLPSGSYLRVDDLSYLVGSVVVGKFASFANPFTVTDGTNDVFHVESDGTTVLDGDLTLTNDDKYISIGTSGWMGYNTGTTPNQLEGGAGNNEDVYWYVAGTGKFKVGGTGSEFTVDASGNAYSEGYMGMAGLASAPTPSNGMWYYDTTTNEFQFYENGAWTGLGGVGYWQRTGTTLHPATSGDDIGIGADDTIDFNYGGTAKTLHYDSTNTQFEFNDDVYSSGYLQLDSAKGLYWNAGNAGIEYYGAPLRLEIWANTNENVDIYAQGTGRARIGSTSWVEFTDGGEMYLDSDKNIYLDTAESKTLQWDSTNTRFEFNDVTYAPNFDLPADGVIDFNSAATAKTLHYDSVDTRFEFNDKVKAPNARIGSDTNYTEFDTDGHQTMVGTARVWKTTQQLFAYNLYGYGGTYNGVSTQASELTIRGGQFLCQRFEPSEVPGNAPMSFIATFVVPDDYVAGEDLKVKLNWCSSSATGGAVHFGVGIAPIDATDDYENPSYTYVTGNYTEDATTAYGAVQTEVTFSSPTGVNPGDDLGVVVYRDEGNAGDTSTGYAYVSTVSLGYISDKVGVKTT